MELDFARKWWTVALRGVLAIAFGVLVFFWPGIWWLAVVCTFAAYAILDGALALSAAVTGQGGRRWALVLEGLVSIAASVLALLWPDITELALLYLIAAWVFVTGVLEIAAALQLRRHVPGEWALLLSGILSVILGVALATAPVAGLLVIAWWIGGYSIAFGVLLLALAFRLRSLARHAPRRESVMAP